MASKVTKVLLQHPRGSTFAFGIEHAEALMRMRNNGGWKVVDEKLKWTENGFVVRTNKGRSKESAEKD